MYHHLLAAGLAAIKYNLPDRAVFLLIALYFLIHTCNFCRFCMKNKNLIIAKQ